MPLLRRFSAKNPKQRFLDQRVPCKWVNEWLLQGEGLFIYLFMLAIIPQSIYAIDLLNKNWKNAMHEENCFIFLPVQGW